MPLALPIIVAGCATEPRDPDWVAKQWAVTMRAYHIEPVYPPTEDIHIGDIYAVDEDQPGDNTAPIALAIKLDDWPMRQDLENYYDNVPILLGAGGRPTDGTIWRQQAAMGGSITAHAPQASEPKSTPGSAKPPGPRIAASGKPHSVFAASGTLTKLPLMALPGFTIAQADAESFRGGVPFHFFSAIFGAARSHQDSIMINIPAAETYGVPAATATARLVTYCAKNQYLCSRSFIADQLASAVGKKPNHTAVYLINRLFLTRSIEYVYDTSSTVGAQAKLLAQLRATTISKTGSGVAAGATNTRVTGDTATAVSDAAKALTAAADALANTRQKTNATTTMPGQAANGGKQSATRSSAGQAATQTGDLAAIKKKLDDLLTTIQGNTSQIDNAPGGSFSISAVSDQGITLVQTFERPIAIGYRAVKMEPLNP